MGGPQPPAVQQPGGPTNGGRPGYGFTPAQLSVLRNQIVAFKTLKSGGTATLSAEVLASIQVPPLGAPSPAAAGAAAGGVATAPAAVPLQPATAGTGALQGYAAATQAAALPGRTPSPAGLPLQQLPVSRPAVPLPHAGMAAQQQQLRGSATPPPTLAGGLGGLQTNGRSTAPLYTIQVGAVLVF